jgi:long-subunit fatty acid transport protein
MKKLLHIIIAGIALTFSSFQLNAADNVQGSSNGDFLKVGAAGAQFLKIGVGARGSAMGAYSAVANDLSSVWWNPAGIADVKTMGGELNYTQWFAGLQHMFAGVSLPIGANYTLAGTITSFTSGDIPVTRIDNLNTGLKYQISDIAATLTFAGYLTEDFSFGISGKYVQNGISLLTSTGVAFDVGTTYNTGLYGIRLAFAMLNLGSKMQYSGADLRTTKKIIQELRTSPIDAEFVTSSYSMPLMFRAGLSSEVYKTEEHKVIVAGDFTTLSDVPEQFALGAEYTFKDLISLRGGYLFNHDQFGLSGGIGINWDSGSGIKAGMDYSINPTSDIGVINRISVKLGF